jgi:enamine deaminase RidA (YjgF/YER057c/UK114 family)
MRRLISSGSPFERDIGYSRAVVVDGWIICAGITGFDYRTMQIAEDIESQTRQCFANIIETLAQAQATLADLVSLRYIVPGGTPDFERCWPILRHHLADIRPAATMIVAGLMDPRMKIEVEVTARRTP